MIKKKSKLKPPRPKLTAEQVSIKMPAVQIFGELGKFVADGVQMVRVCWHEEVTLPYVNRLLDRMILEIEKTKKKLLIDAEDEADFANERIDNGS
jgi:hypothetical protein